jgi:hypothetical protein
MMRERDAAGGHDSATGTILLLIAGPILWALHFAILYFVQSMLCAHRVATALVPGFVMAATLIALAVVTIAIVAPGTLARLLGADDWPGSERSLHARVTRGLAILSAAGIAWAGATALIIPACAMLS